MPVFISYSHKDKEFAHILATNLVKNRTNVWIDDWEVNAGESLIEKIQDALEESSALIVILSKSSVESVWCKKEHTAGIQRELEEKKTLVVPVLLEDCKIPLFLRDKKYADFRENYDTGLADVVAAVSKFTNHTIGRAIKDDYFVDWGFDWGYLDDLFVMKFYLIQHSKRFPYSIMSTIHVLCNEEATVRFNNYKEAELESYGHHVVVESALFTVEEQDDFFVILEDNFAKTKEIITYDPKNEVSYLVSMESRRLGEDTGRDIIINGSEELRRVAKMVKQSVKPPTQQEIAILNKVIQKNISRN